MMLTCDLEVHNPIAQNKPSSIGVAPGWAVFTRNPYYPENSIYWSKTARPGLTACAEI